MKILLVSIPSIHVIRWIEALKSSSIELYWFDILDRGSLNTFDRVHQFTNWKRRKISRIKGEYFLSKNSPFIYKKIQPILEVTINEKLKEIIDKIKPDLVHSFEMQSCSYPIVRILNEFSHIKWLYSCWGSDLFYYQRFSTHKKLIKRVLKRIDYLHTDCERDEILAKKLGFKGKHLGVIPGGAGYNLEVLEEKKLPVNQRKTILIKGYEHKFGRSLNVVKALSNITNELEEYDVVIFGAHIDVINFVNNFKLPFKVFNRNYLTHEEVLDIMGKSLIYVGNSISDGLPNTLLEAIALGAFPIQSNPGKVSEEIIDNGKNGLLISNPNDIEEIKNIILQAINNKTQLELAFKINENLAKNKLEYKFIQNQIIELYKKTV